MKVIQKYAAFLKSKLFLFSSYYFVIDLDKFKEKNDILEFKRNTFRQTHTVKFSLVMTILPLQLSVKSSVSQPVS